jgi:hypothetical protein
MCEIQWQQLNRCNSLFTVDILTVHISVGQFGTYVINLFHTDQTSLFRIGCDTEKFLFEFNKYKTKTIVHIMISCNSLLNEND